MMLLLLASAFAEELDAAPAPGAAAAAPPKDEVVLGSYGRVDAGSNLKGGAGEPPVVVSHPGRLFADPYLELDLGWRRHAESGTTFTALVTPAVSGDLFHYSGKFDATLGVRNLYVEAADLGAEGLSVWAGSRMYRGDDVYLLDFWPLDNLNTVGGGVGWNDERTQAGLHVGINRLAGADWQYQQVEDATPGGVAAEPVTVLDRQRTVASAKVARVIPIGSLSLRPKLYGEIHHIPEGARVDEDRIDTGVTVPLPAENGTLIGGQLSLWGFGDDAYVHLFYKHATGVAAVGELAIPSTGLALDGSVNQWREDVFAYAGNVQGQHWSVAVGGYARDSRDADGNEVDVEDGWEWNNVLRGGVYLGRHLALSAEAGSQVRRPDGINPRTDAWDVPRVRTLALLPAVQMAPGTFGRPQVHLRYSVSFLNEDAMAWFDEQDTRSSQPVQHWLGVGAEWWVNSQGYR